MKNVNMVIISILLYYNLHKSIVNYNIIRLLTIGHIDYMIKNANNKSDTLK